MGKQRLKASIEEAKPSAPRLSPPDTEIHVPKRPDQRPLAELPLPPLPSTSAGSCKGADPASPGERTSRLIQACTCWRAGLASSANPAARLATGRWAPLPAPRGHGARRHPRAGQPPAAHCGTGLSHPSASQKAAITGLGRAQKVRKRRRGERKGTGPGRLHPPLWEMAELEPKGGLPQAGPPRSSSIPPPGSPGKTSQQVSELFAPAGPGHSPVARQDPPGMPRPPGTLWLPAPRSAPTEQLCFQAATCCIQPGHVTHARRKLRVSNPRLAAATSWHSPPRPAAQLI